MLARLIVLGMLATRAVAAPVIHASSAAEHQSLLHRELSLALADVADGYTVDASLLRMHVVTVGNSVEVRAELRGMLSDDSGRIHWSSTTRAMVRGATRDRAALQRDAVAAVAQRLAHVLRARFVAARHSRQQRRR